MGQKQKTAQIKKDFPWRVVLGKHHYKPPPGGWDETAESRLVKPRAWCEDRFGTPHADPLDCPEFFSARWSYRHEYAGFIAGNDAHGDIVRYEDAFYFRRENDAIEFKLRWG